MVKGGSNFFKIEYLRVVDPLMEGGKNESNISR